MSIRPATADPDPETPDPSGSKASEQAGEKPPKRRSLRRFRGRRKKRVRSDLTVGEIIDRTEHAGFGFLLAFLALIAIPFFGLSTPFGLAIAFAAAQMTIGWSKPWLPRWVRRHHVSLTTLQWISTKLTRWTAGLERFIKPRWTLVLRGPFWSLCGVAITIQGFGLALPLPIPGSNWIFILPVIVYAIGLLEDDGLLVLICHGITAAEIVLGMWAWDVVWKSVTSLLHLV
ncbi:MAG TPA: exopolysaccharide biosynthesis protein [Phycisphaerae bacterium]|nr:exopolysaccharide biosynthesis protein [Phycisphaerae bacterium]